MNADDEIAGVIFTIETDESSMNEKKPQSASNRGFVVGGRIHSNFRRQKKKGDLTDEYKAA